MRILVTGGAGFIGSTYVRHLVEGSLPGAVQVTILDKLTYAGTLTNVESALSDGSCQLVEGDICNLELAEELMSGHDVVVHFAAESHVDRSIYGAAEFVRTNVVGTQTLLEAGKKTGLKTFVHVSTDEVYGSIENGSWDEQSPLLPNSPYAASKAASDLIARSYHRTFGMDIRITRSSNNYGPHQFPEKLIPLFITNLIDDLPVPLYGDGRNVREWLHVDDHCRGIHGVLRSGVAGQTYNLGGGHEATNLEMANKIIALMDKDVSYIQPVADRLGHDFRYSLSSGKSRDEVDFEPSIPFAMGLEDTINWYRKNESWWRPLKEKALTKEPPIRSAQL